MTKRETFVTLVTMLCEGFGRPCSDGLLELYWLALADLTEIELKGAVGQAAMTCKFMPTPAELLAIARPSKCAIVEASLAWDAVRQANRKISWTVSQIDFGAHVNAAIRQMGGWDAICSADVDDLNLWKRKEFERLYVEFAGKTIGDMGRALEGPKDGSKYLPAVVPIAGIPSQPHPRSLPAAGSSSAQDLVRELAESKS